MSQVESPANSVEGRILLNINQIVLFLKQNGYLTSYNTVSKHITEGTLVARRGGGFAERTVLSWAKQYVQRRIVNTDPSAGTPPAEPDADIAKRDALVKLQLKEQALRQARFEEEQKLGRYIPIETWEAELGERARAFRIGLERFGADMGVLIACDFGGSAEAAEELASRLGLDASAKTIIMDFALTRVPFFSRRWLERIDLFLDPYSTDQWWTEDMREAFALYLKHKDEPTETVS